jgi:hypothetical protein
MVGPLANPAKRNLTKGAKACQPWSNRSNRTRKSVAGTAEIEVMAQEVAVLPAAADLLPELVCQISDQIRLARRKREQVIEHVRAAGELLRQAKEQIGHGHWVEWLDKNFEFDVSTAQYWMAIAEHWHYLREKTDHDPQMLTVRDARILLRDARAAEKAGLTEAPVRYKTKRRPRVVLITEEIRRYDRRKASAQRQALLDLRAAINEALAKASDQS